MNNPFPKKRIDWLSVSIIMVLTSAGLLFWLAIKTISESGAL